MLTFLHAQGLRYSVWPADGPMYPKLRLKHRPNLISLAGGMEKMPITDPSSRATPLAPSDWKDMIAQAEVRECWARGGKGMRVGRRSEWWVWERRWLHGKGQR